MAKKKINKLDALYAQFKAQEQEQVKVVETIEPEIEPENTKKEQYRELFNSFFVQKCTIIKTDRDGRENVTSWQSDGIFWDAVACGKKYKEDDFESWYSHQEFQNFRFSYRLSELRYFVVEESREYLRSPQPSILEGQHWETLNGVEEIMFHFSIREDMEHLPPHTFKTSFRSRKEAEKWIISNSHVIREVVGREIPRYESSSDYTNERGWMGRDSYW